MKDINIYTLTDPETNQIRYVGATNNPKRRLAAHSTLSRHVKNSYHLSRWLVQILSKNKKPIMGIIETFPYDYKTWEVRENFWINFYRQRGFDLTNTKAGGPCAPTFGRLGKKNSPEHIAKCVLARTGRPVNYNRSAQAKINRSNAHLGHSNSKKPINQFSMEGVFIKRHPSVKEAAQALNVLASGISMNLKGKYRQSKGFIWKYAT